MRCGICKSNYPTCKNIWDRYALAERITLHKHGYHTAPCGWNQGPGLALEFIPLIPVIYLYEKLISVKSEYVLFYPG